MTADLLHDLRRERHGLHLRDVLFGLWSVEDLSKSAKFVGTVIICHMDDGAWCRGFPSVARISALTRMLPTTIHAATKELVEHPSGFMERVGGGGASHVYRLARIEFLQEQWAAWSAAHKNRRSSAEKRTGPEAATGTEKRTGQLETGAEKRTGTEKGTGTAMATGSEATGTEMRTTTPSEKHTGPTATGTEKRTLPVTYHQLGGGSAPDQNLMFGERADVAPVEVNGTKVCAHFPTGDVSVPKSLIVKTGKKLGLSADEAIEVAVMALEGWITDNWKPEQPSAALPGSMERAAKQLARTGSAAAEVQKARQATAADPHFNISLWKL